MANYQLPFSHIKNENEMHKVAKAIVIKPTKHFFYESHFTLSHAQSAVKTIKAGLQRGVRREEIGEAPDVEGSASDELAILNAWLEGSAIGEITGDQLAGDYVADLYDKLAKRTAATYEELDGIQDLISSWGLDNPSRAKKDALDAVDDDREVKKFGHATATLIFELQDLCRTICVFEMVRHYLNPHSCTDANCKKVPYGEVSCWKMENFGLGCNCGCKTKDFIEASISRRDRILGKIQNSIEALKHLLYGMKYEHPGCDGKLLTPEEL